MQTRPIISIQLLYAKQYCASWRQCRAVSCARMREATSNSELPLPELVLYMRHVSSTQNLLKKRVYSALGNTLSSSYLSWGTSPSTGLHA